ncbi:hypothetical protein EDC36_104214 [Tepidimonas ignava]|uniref:Uncharacterized protein n=1 Tax=Tepidimonas ignava TaxID=114249 RepID=A0A4R3LGW0_9BURK|nr:hypothetical protein [Tepidimonas ignava]TCS98790.1 hypothetical protein EDC36_104214 [Tepidimonas ignava]TSE20285.1 hypothetical protein Tigna_01916 [Tepidimonas ignava]
MTLLTFRITLGRGPDARVLHVLARHVCDAIEIALATQTSPPCRLKAEAIGRVA